ncbi:hyaluronidase-1 [Genypterus blacodes]|uniref:hyaluronidase-1 n=1 Tax=Genypterus blacodes TaxID=154954 RepID=UPI003F767929
MSYSHSVHLLLVNVISLVLGLQFEKSHFSEYPFFVVWNAPTSNCLSRYGVDLDLGTFGITQNTNQTFLGENITILYSDKLGLYPWYTSQGVPIHGGVPQNASLDEHLKVTAEDIHTKIPDTDFQGLAVVDWEKWNPIWERNWDSKTVYREGSRALVKSRHPDWTPNQIDALAHKEFEAAGQKFMEMTLRVGQKERPDGLWGYYGYPSCYNYYTYQSSNYTGQCPPLEVQRNNKLLWLWSASSALYPDIYLSLELRGLDKEVLLFTHNRIQEAMRVREQAIPAVPPVYVYARIVYTYTLDFLPQEHLVYTVAESAALGAGGVVLWGDAYFSKSKATCQAVKAYIDETLGPYVVNVTAAAVLCSQVRCSFNGRCQRSNPESRAYLHLHPASWKVVPQKSPNGRQNYMVVGKMMKREVGHLNDEFQCRCYPGWIGDDCSKPQQR